MAKFNDLIKGLRETQVWRSIFRHGYAPTERNQSLAISSNFFLHLHPAKVRRHALKFTYTLGLGGLSFFLFLVLTVTGILLMIYYVPSTKEAYNNMKDLEFVISYGLLLRNLHRWSAHLMVLVVFFHMCRVFYTGGYKRPREFNWGIGVVLLLLTLFLSFTGYLLPWDQLAFWAITVGTNIASYAPILGPKIRYALLGGNIVGQNALMRFYVLHVTILPVLMGTFLAIHFWRIRKDGGISGPPIEEVGAEEEAAPAPLKTYGLMGLVKGPTPMVEKEPEDTEFTFPNLVYKEIKYAMLIMIILHVFSFFFNAPLEELADPEHTPNPAKAPWYFLGLQELVSYSAFLGGVLAPALAVIGIILIPFIDRNPSGVGVWFSRERKLAIILFSIFVLTAVILTIIGTYLRGPNWGWYWPWQEWPKH
ncbi:MAG: cytochrome B6 [Nitrospinae bacterium RIFCSPLOWO2_12_FULL_45_22]|nr:MAG: cytochrome B6 [Nitrospinae bacterium RIFCSPLOWO2_12_FULL_45_22]